MVMQLFLWPCFVPICPISVLRNTPIYTHLHNLENSCKAGTKSEMRKAPFFYSLSPEQFVFFSSTELKELQS